MEHLRILQEDSEPPTEQTIQKPEEQTQYLSQSIIVMLILVFANTICLSYLQKAREKSRFVERYIQDAIITTAIGAIAGTFLKVNGMDGILITIKNGYASLFMIVLLPPIIFESALNMHKRSFFKNIGSILTYALIGTFLATFLTAILLYFLSLNSFVFPFTFAECAAFGAIVSATDPVTVLAIFKKMNANKNIYSLIFGESILNDAVAIVLYKTIHEMSEANYEGTWLSPIINFNFIFWGSCLLGAGVGLLCAIIIRRYVTYERANSNNGNNRENGNSQQQQGENSEVTMMILIPWVSYLVGEGTGLSGIVVIMFCGITITKYALPNLTKISKRTTQRLYGNLSSISENMVFIFIGIGFFSYNHQWAHLGIMALILTPLIITFARFLQIKFISHILNKFRKKNKITNAFQTVMIYSGFRGAMAFALAANADADFTSDQAGSKMLTLTLMYASLTIIILGTFLVPVLQKYNVAGADDDSIESNQSSRVGDIVIPEEVSHEYCWDKTKNGIQSLDAWLTRNIVRPQPQDEDDQENGTTHVLDHSLDHPEAGSPNEKGQLAGNHKNYQHFKDEALDEEESKQQEKDSH